jgi:hypothetical protein
MLFVPQSEAWSNAQDLRRHLRSYLKISCPLVGPSESCLKKEDIRKGSNPFPRIN